MGHVGNRVGDQNPMDALLILTLYLNFLWEAVNSATEIGKDQPLLVISELTQLFPRPTSACLPACQMLTNESENQVTQRTLGCRHNTLTPTKRIILIHHFSFFWWSKTHDSAKVLMRCWWRASQNKAERKLITGQRKKMHQEKVLFRGHLHQLKLSLAGIGRV